MRSVRARIRGLAAVVAAPLGIRRPPSLAGSSWSMTRKTCGKVSSTRSAVTGTWSMKPRMGQQPWNGSNASRSLWSSSISSCHSWTAWASSKSPGDAGTVAPTSLSGYTTWDLAVEAIQLGAADYLPKPFPLDLLRLVVGRTLHAQRLAERAQQADLYEKLAHTDGLTGAL